MKIFLFLILFIPVITQGQECDIVATVFSKVICRFEISSGLDKTNKHYEFNIKNNFNDLVNDIGIENLIDKSAYEVKDFDIEKTTLNLKEKTELKIKWRKKIIRTIKYMLSNYTYSAKYRKRLEDGLNTQKEFLQNYGASESLKDNISKYPEFKKRYYDETRLSLAKTKKVIALIAKYKTFSAFIDEIKNKGKLVIKDDLFKDTIESNATKKDTAIPFLTGKHTTSNESYFQSMIKDIKAIPHLHPDLDSL